MKAVNKANRILSFFLAVVILCAVILPQAAINANAETYSGTCGENLTWTLDTSTGLLTITGNGSMHDSLSWYNYRNNIKSVNMSYGVTTISDYAFRYCSSLTKITIPNSVTSIGSYAFYECSSLAEVNIPGNVNSLNTRAFYCCAALKNVTIGYGVLSIGYGAFTECSSLVNLIIPTSVTSIGSAAFSGCSALASIIIPDSVTTLNTFYLFSGCKSLTSATLPNSVTSIEEACFSGCNSLVSAEIPSSVTSVGRCAYYCCYALENVTIPYSVTNIGDTAFGACSNLKSLIVLNPDCAIFDNRYTLGDANKTIIHGKTDSTALVYAKKYGYKIAEHIWEETNCTATCTTAGVTDYVCTICNDTKSEFTPSGHIWSEPTYQWSEDNSNVTATRICKRDESHIETETVQTLSEVTLPATCLSAGETTYTAVFPNEAFETQSKTVANIDPLGHNLVHHDAQEPTCTEIGWEDYDTCTRCNYSTRVVLPALGHDLTPYDAQAPTCTEIGWDNYGICNRCGYSSYVELPALGHSFQSGICARCGIADPFYANAKLTISTLSIYAKPGTTVSIPVSVSGSANIAGFTLSISTDEWLTLVNVEKGAFLKEAGGTLTKNLEQGVVNWNNVNEVEANGEILVLTFTVDEEAEIDSRCAIRLRLMDDRPTNMTDASGNAVSTRFQDGTIVVSPIIYGDTNTDDDVNSADAVRLVRSLVLMETLTEDQRLAADVSHDSEVTSADSVILTRYLAGFEDRLDIVPNGRSRAPERAGSTVTIVGGSVTGRSGSTVSLPVTIKDNPGLAGFTLHVDYPETLELISGEAGTVLAASEGGALLVNAEKNLINWNDAQNTSGDGLLLTLTFRIKDGAADGTYEVGLSLRDGKAGNFVDEHGTPIGTSFFNGKVTVKNQLQHFTDVPYGAFYQPAVDWAVEHGITSGTSVTTFSPADTCTRAQVVTFLWRAKGQPEPTKTDNPFTDVQEGTYYYKAVLWAVENGITAGTSATTFSPNAGCTRSQVVTFLWRTEGEPEPTSSDNPFTDVTGGYYYTAVLWAVENKITAGTSATNFSPNATCTRGQIVTFLYRDMEG